MKSIIHKTVITTSLILLTAINIYSSNNEKKDSLKLTEPKECLQVVGMAVDEKNE